MLIELIALIATGAILYFWHEKVLKDKLDTPRNNPNVKGLDKKEIKEKMKEGETGIKGLKEEIKEIDKERKELLKDENKKDEAQEKTRRERGKN